MEKPVFFLFVFVFCFCFLREKHGKNSVFCLFLLFFVFVF